MHDSNSAVWLALVFSHPTLSSAVQIAAKTSIIYLFLVAGLRLMGRRQLGQMNLYDLVLIVVLANAVQNAMVGDDNTLVGGIVSAVTLLLWNRMFSAIMAHSTKAEHLLVGGPILLVNDGKFLDQSLRKQGVTREQILTAVREHGMNSIDDAHMCVLESDGAISVVPADSQVHRSRRHFKGLRLS